MNIQPTGAALAGVAKFDPAPTPRRSGRIDDLEGQLDALTRRARFAVIHAGSNASHGAVIHSTVHTRSWKSYEPVAQDIAAALRRIGCRDVAVLPEDMHLGARLRAEATDLAWLNTGGVQGYDPVCHAPAMLELCGVPYVGHDPLIASTLDNKHAFKRELMALGLPTARFTTWHMGRGPLVPAEARQFRKAFGEYDGPFIVKPVSGRASLHVHKIDNIADLPGCVAAVHEITQNHVLIEEYLPGREFCVAVCGPVTAQGGRLERRDRPFAFSALERVLRPDEDIFTSMDVCPITQARLRVLDPAVDGALVAELEQLARDVFNDMCLETLVRVDIRADAAGRLHVLEANPKPDLKAPADGRTNLVCAGLVRHGMDYDDLVLSLLADRIDTIFGQRRGTGHHLLSLVR
ncbi:MAG: ATP-grasp domain-containing protein [Alphaproteobacteria bacterium]